MPTQNSSILFLGKSEDDQCRRALEFCRTNFTKVESYLGRFGRAPCPPEVTQWTGDYIISYLCPWVVPQPVIQRASKAAINFHPATPDFPGIGCNNFALYNNVPEYGATCHHMAAQVDTGAVIAVKKFPVFETDTVSSILTRTHDHQLSLFYDIMSFIVAGKDLPVSKETWSRKPYTRKELNELATLRSDMSKDEMSKRIRATAFENWLPTIEIQGFTFELKMKK